MYYRFYDNFGIENDGSDIEEDENVGIDNEEEGHDKYLSVDMAKLNMGGLYAISFILREVIGSENMRRLRTCTIDAVLSSTGKNAPEMGFGDALNALVFVKRPFKYTSMNLSVIVTPKRNPFATGTFCSRIFSTSLSTLRTLIIKSFVIEESSAIAIL
jgi:hypothetical protein